MQKLIRSNARFQRGLKDIEQRAKDLEKDRQKAIDSKDLEEIKEYQIKIQAFLLQVEAYEQYRNKLSKKVELVDDEILVKKSPFVVEQEERKLKSKKMCKCFIVGIIFLILAIMSNPHASDFQSGYNIGIAGTVFFLTLGICIRI